MKTPHKWFLTFDSDVPEQLRDLSINDRKSVFKAIAELLIADNPKALANVKKLHEKRFENLWRQRQGDYRIFFEITPGEIEKFNHLFKGIIHIVSVVHRSEAY